MRVSLRLPIVLYRMGWGGVLDAINIMILTTRGRKSGSPRHTAIEYRRHGSKLYLISLWGDVPQWYQNICADSTVAIQMGKRHLAGRAYPVNNAGEALRVLHLFRRRAPAVYDALIARLTDRDKIDLRTLPDVSGAMTIIRIDPLPDAPIFPPVQTDLAWVSPVCAVLMMAVMALRRVRR